MLVLLIVAMPKMTRREFVGASLAAGVTLGPLAREGLAAPPEAATRSFKPVQSPRSRPRLIYVSDPSSIAAAYLPFSDDDTDTPDPVASTRSKPDAVVGQYGWVDHSRPVTEAGLRRWVDELAEAQVDTFVQEAYTQGWTTYWRTAGFEYDARPQHRRFLPLLDAGIQPLGVLLDQSRRRGMEFLAGLRINDNHGHISVKQGVGAGASFLLNNPQWRLQEAPPGAYYKLSTPLDFSFSEVRDFIFSVAAALVGKFPVDGLELCFRDHRYFPVGRGRERQPLMTDLVARIRRMLEENKRDGKKRLKLGARVYQTLDECQDQGLDVARWISDGLLDYVAPGDVMYSDLNAPYERFVELGRRAKCDVYPSMQPWTSVRMRSRHGGMPLSLDQQRAVVKNFYGAGADGFSSYNHFVPIHAAPFYPMMLEDFRELKDPQQLDRGNRHYVFEPIWGGTRGFGADGNAPTGHRKADQIVLRRSGTTAKGSYRFRLCEDFRAVRRALLLFRGRPMSLKDRLRVTLNGTEIAPAKQKRRSDEVRVDLAAPVDVNSRTTAGEPPVPESGKGPVVTTWFDLKGPPAVNGDNLLEVSLLSSDAGMTEDIVIDEIEVFVRPKIA